MQQFNHNKGFLVNVGQRYLLLMLSAFLCYIIGAVLSAFIAGREMTTERMRLAMIVTDLLVFILPALIVAMLITRRPADFLQITGKPGVTLPILVLFTMIAAAPAMNCLIELNQGIHFPESMAALEDALRSAESKAQESMDILTSNYSVGGLVMSILIVGVLASFSEELFFRGTVLRVFQTTPMNMHLAVWGTAVIFSAMHMQFFGFLPRLLLGGFFGYLALWSGSLWLAVIGHVLNNTIAVLLMWFNGRSCGSINIDSIGTSAGGGHQVAIVAVSVALTALLIWQIYRTCKLLRHRSNQDA